MATMKMKTEKVPLIPGFKAVESARAWKVKVAREIEELSVAETLNYFRAAARDLKPAGRRTSAVLPTAMARGKRSN